MKAAARGGPGLAEIGRNELYPSRGPVLIMVSQIKRVVLFVEAVVELEFHVVLEHEAENAVVVQTFHGFLFELLNAGAGHVAEIFRIGASVAHAESGEGSLRASDSFL